MLPLILESMQDKQIDKLRFISPLNSESTQDRQTDQLCFISTLIGIQVRLTDKLHVISSHYIWIYIRQTDYTSFHPSYLDQRKKDRRTNYASFHPPIGMYEDRHFTPHDSRANYGSFLESSQEWDIVVLDRQTDKLRFISPLILVSKENRRTNYVTCYNLKIKFDFLSIILIPQCDGKQTDKLRFI